MGSRFHAVMSRSFWIALLKLHSSLLVLPTCLSYWHLSSRWQFALESSRADLVQVRVESDGSSGSTQTSANGIYRETSHQFFTRVSESVPIGADALVVAEYINRVMFAWHAVRPIRKESKWSLQKLEGADQWSLVSPERRTVAVSGDDEVSGAYFSVGPGENDRNEDSSIVARVMRLYTERKDLNRDADRLESGNVAKVKEMATSHALGFRVNPNKDVSRQPSPLVEYLFYMPATATLIFLNGLLFFLYWLFRVEPSAVALSYTRILHHGQVWRTYSGSTAHFEIWHLGFNMMSLYALGQDLEGDGMYSSVAFFLTNISFISLTTAVWLGLQYVSLAYSRRVGTAPLSEERLTVGYSGVLFAWMVVAALNRAETCPIPFLPQLCFKTFHVGWIPFSFGPLVQLAVAQMILPRVSFIGHLAGLLLGFLMHWGLLPVSLVQPACIIPLLYFGFLKYVRKLMPSCRTLSLHVFSRDGTMSSGILCYLLLLLVSTFSSFEKHAGSRATLLFPGYQALTFWLASRIGRDGFIEGSDRHQTLSRAFITVAVLVLLNESLAIGSWLAASDENVSLLLLITLLRWEMLLIGACCSCEDLVRNEGIMLYSLGYLVIDPGRVVGKAAKSAFPGDLTSIYMVDEEGDETVNADDWAPFIGRGHVLGSEAERTRSDPVVTTI